MIFKERSDRLRADIQTVLVPLLDAFFKETGVYPTLNVSTTLIDVSTNTERKKFIPGEPRISMDVKL